MSAVHLPSGAQEDSGAMQARMDSLTRENAALRAENARLRAALEAAITAGSPTGTMRESSSTDGTNEASADTLHKASAGGTRETSKTAATPPPAAVATPVLTEEPTAATLPSDNKAATSNDALAQMKKTTDAATGVTTYRYSHGMLSDGNLFTTYLTERSGDVTVHINIVYTDSRPIAFDAVYLSYDGNTLPIPFTADDKTRTTTGSPKTRRYREEVDVPSDDDTTAFLKAMTGATETTLRLEGQSTDQRPLTKRERRALAAVLAAYDQLTRSSGQP